MSAWTAQQQVERSIQTVERSIQTVKSLLRKATDNGSDPYIALLQYRNAPISDLDGLSPAHLLFSQRLKTKLSVTAESLEPETQKPRNKLIARQERQKQYFDRTVHNLPPLKPGDVIRFVFTRMVSYSEVLSVKHWMPHVHMLCQQKLGL